MIGDNLIYSLILIDFGRHMKVTLAVEADELKIAQLLSKFAEKYRMTYKLNRQARGFRLDVELDSEDFGEFVRRMNHLKNATVKNEEVNGGGVLGRGNIRVKPTKN